MSARRGKSIDGFFILSFAMLSVASLGSLCLALVVVALDKRLTKLGGQGDASFRVQTILVGAAEGAQEGHGRTGKGGRENQKVQRADKKASLRQESRAGRKIHFVALCTILWECIPLTQEKRQKKQNPLHFGDSSSFCFSLVVMKSPLFAIILLLLSALALFWTFFPPPLP